MLRYRDVFGMKAMYRVYWQLGGSKIFSWFAFPPDRIRVMLGENALAILDEESRVAWRGAGVRLPVGIRARKLPVVRVALKDGTSREDVPPGVPRADGALGGAHEL
jgi:hypothetical protein